MTLYFGARIDPLPVTHIVSLLEQMVQGDRTHFITTPNPEMLLHARRVAQFRGVMSKADFGVIDGIGLLWMLKLKGVRGAERFTGVDLVYELARVCTLHGKKICFVGGSAEALQDTRQQFASLDAAGGILSILGPVLDYHEGALTEQEGASSMSTHATIEHIKQFAPDVLLVGFGHGKQEVWISQILDKLPSVRVAAGVGGAFDIISGTRRRAPLFFRRLGLEWLWRLILEPRRIGRIARAVVVFPLVALFQKIQKEI